MIAALETVENRTKDVPNFWPVFQLKGCVMASQPTPPPGHVPPIRNKGFIAGLKGNQWVFISPDHKVPPCSPIVFCSAQNCWLFFILWTQLEPLVTWRSISILWPREPTTRWVTSSITRPWEASWRKGSRKKNQTKDTLPETHVLHLKMNGWNTSFLLGRPFFRCYVSSGRVFGVGF